MPIGRRDDLAFSILLIIPVFLYASMGGDSLYTGAWYLIGVPAAIVVSGMILRVPALFLTGATVAALGTLLIYLKIMFNLERPDGLLALGHIFSAPGMLVGMSLSAWLVKHRVKVTLPWIVAGFGFLGAAFGFLVAQIIVCNSLMRCGAMSLGG